MGGFWRILAWESGNVGTWEGAARRLIAFVGLQVSDALRPEGYDNAAAMLGIGGERGDFAVADRGQGREVVQRVAGRVGHMASGR
jgi:hypothetical protein